jgi:hypothetical protein
MSSPPLKPLTAALTSFWRRCQQSLQILILLIIPLAGTACTPQPTATPTPSPEVIATFMAAVVTAQVVEEDGCLKLVTPYSNRATTLVFPPDASATIAGDKVTIVTGLVTGKREGTVLNFGDWATMGGGERSFLREELLNTLPAKCQQPPHWVVGDEVRPAEPQGISSNDGRKTSLCRV